jgi:hypothetical protein
MDEKRTEIGWVGVVQEDGTMIQYTDPAKVAEITPDKIEKEKRLMDCMDCHNRATHVFRSPEDLIDEAMAQGRLDVSLPYLKRQGVQALDPENSSLAEAYAKVDQLRDFYKNDYPAVYAEKQKSVDAAVGVLKEVARLTTFPTMNVNWDSYVNQLGHTQSPGCFRCHGKLVATLGPTEGKPVDSGCESCHFFQLPGKS